MNTNPYTFNDSNWVQLLDNSSKNQQHIFCNQETKEFYLNESHTQYTDKTIKELNPHQIIDFTKQVDAQRMDADSIHKIAASLNQMADKIEKKYFSGFGGRIFKIFNAIYNGFSGRGFQTTASEAKEVASHLLHFANKPDQTPDLTTPGKPHEPIIYVKGEKKTRDVIPTKKEIMGEGKSGKVHEHRDKPSIVVKKTEEEIEKEYKLGAKLDHPNLVKIHDLFIKKYPDSNKYKLVMDKVEGKNFTDYYFDQENLSDETVKKLLEQAQDCCLYLFSQNIGWADINDGNIFVVKDTNDLKLIDFGHWKEIENPQERALQLLLGSMEIVGWIIKTSSLRKKPEQGLEAIRNPREEHAKQELALVPVMFPEKFFGEKLRYVQILSIDPDHYEDDEWIKKIQEDFKSKTEEEIKEVLKQYFNDVIEMFNQSITHKDNG